MLQSIMWQLIWVLIRVALSVSKDMVLATIKLVTEAEDKKHEDGTPLTGTEKRNFVLQGLISAWSNEDWNKVIGSEGQSTINLLIEAAVSYAKSFKK